MRKPFTIFASLMCTLLFTTSLVANNTPSYIEKFKDIAIREMHRSGIPASITLAQAILESGWGNGDIAVHSNNYFGIKCKDYWTGPKYYAKDDDMVNGKLIKSCFRAYENIEDSFVDHSDFLKDNPRYQSLFELSIEDYKGWARGLKECGYATNEKYAESLIANIEKYGLNKYDYAPSPQEQVPVVAITKPNKVQQPAMTAAAAPGFVVPGLPTANTASAPVVQIFTPATPVVAAPVVAPVVTPEVITTPVFELEEENYDIPSTVSLPDDYERGANRTEVSPAKPLYLGNTPSKSNFNQVAVEVIPDEEVGEPFAAIVPQEEQVVVLEEAIVYEEEGEDVYESEEPLAEPEYTPAQPYQQPLPPANPMHNIPAESPAPQPEAIVKMTYVGVGEKESTQLSRRPRVSSSRRR